MEEIVTQISLGKRGNIVIFEKAITLKSIYDDLKISSSFFQSSMNEKMCAIFICRKNS